MSLSFEKVKELTVKEFKSALLHALRTLLGTCGAATEVRKTHTADSFRRSVF